jgi:hypothetical protein
VARWARTCQNTHLSICATEALDRLNSPTVSM